MKKRFFSRLTALVLTALMPVGVLPIAVWADASDFSYYISTNADGEYAVIDGYYGDGGTVVVPAEIDGLPVLQIAYGVFGSNTEITHVTVSEGILHLSGNVFSWSSVESVSLPSTLTTISSQCFIYSDLTEITIPEGVTLLGSGVFEGCEALTDVYFEAKAPHADWDERWADNCHANIWYDGVLTAECVKDELFLYRVEGKQATVLDYIGDYYAKRAVVPETVGGATVTAIGADAFKDVYYLQEIVLPETVTVIANNAFLSCGSLEKINLPLGLTHIGMQAFMWCGNLQELRIPETVTYIGNNAFYDDYAALYFEASAASDGWEIYWAECFYGSIVWDACVHRDVTVDEVQKTCETDGYRRVTCNDCGEELSYEFFALGHEYVYGVCSVCGHAKDTWDELGYYYDYYYGNDGTETYGIIIGTYYGTEQYVSIPSEIGGVPVIGIGSSAFEGNKTILGVQIPGSVKFIGDWAFANSSLRTAELGEGAEQIRGCVFHNSKLQMINFPSTLTEIGDCAFVETKLYRIEIPESVTYIGNQAFLGCRSLTEIRCGAVSQPEGWHEQWDESLTAEEYFADRLAVMYYTENDTVYRIDIPGYDAAEGVATLYDYNGAEDVVEIPAAVDVWPVVKIGYGAFQYLGVTSVTIPDSVTEIGGSAFSSCDALTEVNIPDSVTAIGSSAFGDCDSLTEITIPASVETMEYAVFRRCESLQNIYCAAATQPETWDEYWIYHCEANVYFDGVMFMGTQDGYLFEIADGGVLIKNYSGGETEIVVPSEISGYPVTEIGDNAFTNRYNVTSIVLPDTLRIIRDAAFADCDALTEITIPASVEVMGSSVFRDCDNLQNIYCETASQPEKWDFDWFGGCKANVWLDGVLVRGQIDGYVFETVDGNAIILEYIGGETELVIPDELMGYPVTEIGEYAFAYLYGVTSVVLPDTVTKLGYSAFCYNTSLESIELSAGLTEIGVRAFEECRMLKTVTIPDGVTSIGEYAFGWCYGLTEITIPASVEKMGGYVFTQDYALTDIYCKAESQPEQWDYYWAGECGANVWFGGVMVQGVIDGFSFRVVDGEAQILDYVVEIPEGETIEIDIPEMLGGAPVTRIGEYAFAYLSGVTGISVPDTVTHFGYEAFSYNDSLTEITIPASVVSMGGWIFRGCSLLTDIYCEEAFRPEGWDYNWAAGWSGNIWFDGVLTQGVLDGFEIRSEDGKAVIYDYVGDATEIVIPSEIGGLPVTVIAEQAFSSLSGVTSITIPDSVENIYYEAFAYNDSLIEITIPASVTFMSGDVFYHCDNLQNIYCEAASEPETWNYDWANGCNASIWFDGVLSIGVIDGFKIRNADGLAEIIDYVGNATEIVIPSELGGMPVAGIGYSAFSDLYEVTSITIPDTVTFIGNNAFACCYELTEITIPESVEYMQRDVFRDCTSLQNIYCEAESRPDVWDYNWANGCDASIWFGGVLTQGVIDGFKFTTENGAVKILDYFGSATEIVIPSELGGMPVTAIASQAFSDCDWITDVTVPDSVVYIGYEAFAYCGGLTEMTIPESVLHMDSDVFWNCGNLQNIYCEAVSEPDGWSFDWASACNAAIYFDGVMARGVIGDYRVEFEDGKATILGYLGIESEPVIPAEIDGRPVVAIGYEAFAYNENLIGVTIPASIIRMDSDVFYGCVGLQNIYCESAEEPNDWNYYWTNGCDANVYYNGVLLRGTADGFRFYAEGEGVLITEYFGNESEAVIPAELAGLPVVAIEAYAFAESGFTSVVIPDSVVYIGYEAFAYCRNLTEITIPESVLYMESDVFWGCSSMETVYCEASAQAAEWREGWLGNCRANIYFGGVLTIGTFGDYHADISGDGAVILGYCGEGGGITVPAEIGGKPVTHIGAEAFMGQNITSIVLPETLRVIGSYAFAETALTEITVPASVVLIGSSVFSGCAALQNIYLAPDADIESWPGNWCLYCEADIYRGETQITFRDGDYRIMLLESGVTILDYVGEGGDLVVPETFGGIPVVAIGRGAFDYLDSLTSVVLPDSVVSLGDRAFNGCYNLQSVVLPEKLESIGYSAFCDCASLTEIAIPGTVAYIADEAFAYCRNLTKVFLGNGVLDIGFGAFAGCTALQSIVLPNTLLAISDYAFAETALTEITIPESVEYVGAAVFAMAKSLAVIYCEAEDIGNWEPFWLEGCGAEVVLGVAPCLHETVAEETKAPTCGYGGYLRTVCTDCGTVLEETIFPATGEHEMDLPAVGGPDCEGWSITYGCKNCDYTETLVVPATGHAYGKDGVCTKCGESTVELVISVGNASAKPGETFEVEVMLDHNTGFTWLELVPEFDPDVLELISVENGNISNLSSNGEIYVWSSASNATATGKLCTLVFAVREDAAVSKTAVSVSVSMCNSAGGMFCAVAVNDGVISANSFVYGDVNGDGKITGTDVTRLLRYIANRNPVTGESSVEIGEGSDCNGDGKITGTDVTRLLRYIANRNPVTGESSVTLGPST